MTLDYRGLGFRCGLEIHQQLEARKLFCACESRVVRADERLEPQFELTRRLRPSASELGEVDIAATKEFARGRAFHYLGYRGLSCLVECDEEPPHAANREAVEAGLVFALLVAARPVDEVHWMRKIVIDGSNTSGFQRTGMVALGGAVAGIGIQTIALEEDSCRKVGEEGGIVTYGLDRLGIPLIEVATEPTIPSPADARRVAARLGAVLRATGRVKRGLGTIRQDLNVSVRGGSRIEVKGVQELRLIAPVLEYEVRRQVRLLEIAEELKKRGARPGALGEPGDVTDLFRATASGVLKGALARGGVVLALALPGFAGLLGAERKEDPRLGRELAGYAKADAGVRGLFHGDELPAYGITPAEVAEVRERLALGERDSFVLVAEEPHAAKKAMRAVRERAALAFGGVPEEVRNAEEDATTSYMRPLPGAARMYPETDVPPVPVPAETLAQLRAALPELPEAKVERFERSHGLSRELAEQVVQEGHESEFEALAKAVGEGTLVATTLLVTRPELVAKGVPEEALDAGRIESVLRALREGRFARDALPQVLEAAAREPSRGVPELVEGLGLATVGEEEVARVARRVVREREAFVRERGEAALGPLMGLVMKELRGRADGQLVSRMLSQEIGAALKAR